MILTLSEKAGAGRKVRKAHVPSGRIESIRVLADTTAVEIYVNGGEVCFLFQILSGNAGTDCEGGGCGV